MNPSIQAKVNCLTIKYTNTGLFKKMLSGPQNYDVKLDIPEFEGKNHPNDFIDWLNSIERNFDN